MSTYITEEKSHGRLEKRTCSIFDTALLEQEGMYEQWTGLKRIIKMDREHTQDDIRSHKKKQCCQFIGNAQICTGNAQETG